MVTLSCGNRTHSNDENTEINNSKTDDYSVLFETNKAPKRIEENLSGKVIVISEKDFIERITDIDNPKGFQYKGQTPCIVVLFAYWCTACYYQANILDDIAPEYQGKVIFYKLDIEKAYDVKAAFKIESIPMMFFFKPRGRISTTIGLLNREKLTNMIDELLLNP
jgi:thioredoxin-like negative regulator of GroEL